MQYTFQPTSTQRKVLSLILPAILVHLLYWPIVLTQGTTIVPNLFIENIGQYPRYLMTITMIFGSMIAGATSEGGASVAFPVLTLIFQIQPTIARDFSFMIQSVGMTAASFSILSSRIRIEYHALKWVSIGGIFGLIIGLEGITPYLPARFSKMLFVTIWGSFAFSLFLQNQHYNRTVLQEIPIAQWNHGWHWWQGKINMNAVVLFLAGVFGGIFSAIAGSGIDICSFAVLTLLFRIDEKIATPTSVLLMAFNTCVGFLYRQVVQGGVSAEAWPLFVVCVPVVVLGAPLGSVLGSWVHRLTLARMIYFTDLVQLVGALVIVKPWLGEDAGWLMSVTVAVCLVSCSMFYWMSRGGLRLLSSLKEDEREVEMRTEGEEMDVVDVDVSVELEETKR